MRRLRRGRTLILAALAALVLSGTALAAAAGGGYTLAWFTVDGGGGPASGGSYALSGTAGQPDAGALSGGGYTLQGGFWSAAPAAYRLYMPLAQR